MKSETSLDGKDWRSVREASEDIITERNTTHGDFDRNAQISQDIKAIFRASPGWEFLTYRQKEALDVIALKQSRILSGRAEFPDHWIDIEGYARLGKGDQPTKKELSPIGVLVDEDLARRAVHASEMMKALHKPVRTKGENLWTSVPTPQSGSPSRPSATSLLRKTKKRRSKVSNSSTATRRKS